MPISNIQFHIRLLVLKILKTGIYITEIGISNTRKQGISKAKKEHLKRPKRWVKKTKIGIKVLKNGPLEIKATQCKLQNKLASWARGPAQVNHTKGQRNEV